MNTLIRNSKDCVKHLKNTLDIIITDRGVHAAYWKESALLRMINAKKTTFQ